MSSEDEIIPKSVADNSDDEYEDYYEEDYSEDNESQETDIQNSSDRIISPETISITPKIRPPKQRTKNGKIISQPKQKHISGVNGINAENSKRLKEAFNLGESEEETLETSASQANTSPKQNLLKYNHPENAMQECSLSKSEPWYKNKINKCAIIVSILIVIAAIVIVFIILRKRRMAENNIFMSGAYKEIADKKYEEEQAKLHENDDKHKELSKELDKTLKSKKPSSFCTGFFGGLFAKKKASREDTISKNKPASKNPRTLPKRDKNGRFVKK